MTADERLALVRLKIERANKHIDDLQSAIQAFFNPGPYKIAAKRDPQTRRLIYYLASMEPVPASIRAITGDILNSLRSALDHLAQHLYLVGSGANEYRNKTSFPISPSAKDFKSSFVAKKTEGMREDAINAILALEPYGGGKGADLWTLDRLNNIDKHRLIIAVWSTLGGVGIGNIMAKFTSISPEAKKEFKQFTDTIFIAESPVRPLKTGDELFTDLPDAEPDEDRKFRFQISIHEPGVMEGRPVLETLVQFRDRVNGIVEAFRPFLS